MSHTVTFCIDDETWFTFDNIPVPQAHSFVRLTSPSGNPLYFRTATPYYAISAVDLQIAGRERETKSNLNVLVHCEPIGEDEEKIMGK